MWRPCLRPSENAVGKPRLRRAENRRIMPQKGRLKTDFQTAFLWLPVAAGIQLAKRIFTENTAARPNVNSSYAAGGCSSFVLPFFFGRTKRIRRPLGLMFSALMLPQCCSTMCFAKAKPKPVPGLLPLLSAR